MATHAKVPRMAAKVETEDVNGFIHSVSPPKKSRDQRCEFFNATIQTGRNEFHNTVVYEVQKRTHFLNAATAKTPVHLTNVRRTISFLEPDSYDFKCNKYTAIEPIDAKEIDFTYKQPKENTVCPIKDVQQAVTNQYVTVIGKVLDYNKDNVTEIKTKMQSVLPMTEAIIGDQSASIVVCVWSNYIDQLQLGQSYKFQFVSVKDFDNVKKLSTSPKTVISNIEDIGPVKAPDVTLPVSPEINGKIVLVKIQEDSSCLKCKKPITLSSGSKFIKCACCEMVQKIDNVAKLKTVSLTLDTDLHQTYTMFNETFETFLKDCNKERLDTQELEEFLLDDLTVSIKANGSAIKSITVKN